MTDSEWEERQKTRQLEMEACSKALAVLSSDDAHDLFTFGDTKMCVFEVLCCILICFEILSDIVF